MADYKMFRTNAFGLFDYWFAGQYISDSNINSGADIDICAKVDRYFFGIDPDRWLDHNAVGGVYH